ncbi:TPA: Bro-N domain-containing protein [Candidatus Woesearchaeota archaeon]|nr:Bro-N domain-containing protein [Candidatus Woesearchaeota archaeon]HIH31468.1 Bro-N domain-containing protein [Candidatus Woesearchaeota archaeon]HIH55247.1 Bro-N domain-containing protein [Candidatus Woesearchaeota archaeon]HIJ01968.1 Bro-N domain-containing protein [Candidatus Woesearchaeota archaeon]
MNKDNALVVFQDKKIRRIWHENEWYFSVVDIIEVLTDSPTPRQYWGKVKDREFSQLELSPIWVQLKLSSTDGKFYETDCANTKAVFRIIQSIPSKKAEPFKLWLAKVGYERVQEIENPELAQERMKELYEQKGYSKSWIDKRLRGIVVRQDLTDEWKKRGVTSQEDFAILTAEISKATFDMTPAEYKKFKGLQKENLRDHMNDLELIFSMLGEASTSEIEKTQNPETFPEHKVASRKGGKISKDARIALEKESKRKVISKENYLDEPESKKRLEQK